MAYFISVWIILLLVCVTIGTGILQRLGGSSIERWGDRVFLSIWLGLLLLSAFLLATSLVVPLSPLVGLAVALILCTITLAKPETRRELRFFQTQLTQKRSGVILSVILGVMVAIAALSSSAVTWADTGLYHYGTVRWLADFGAVPGVALLFANFGFTSAWFALSAPLNPDFLGDRVSAVANGFVVLLGVLQFLLCAVRLWQSRAKQSDWFILTFLALVLPMIMGYEVLSLIRVSPSPDLPLLFLIGEVAWTMLLPTDRSASAALTQSIVLAAGAVTLKLIALPLLLVSGTIFFLHQCFAQSTPLIQRGREIVIAGVLVCILLLPLIVHSLVTSGCPLFPSSLFCLAVPWSPQATDIKEISQATHHWLTWYGQPPAGVHPWLWGAMQWLKSEWANQILAGLIGFCVIGAIDCTRAAVKQKRSELLWVVAIALTGISFVMLTAPFFRFCMGYIVLIPALTISVHAESLSRVLTRLKFVSNRFILSFPRLAIGVGGAIVLMIIMFQLQGDYSRILLPPPIRPIQTTEKRVNDVVYNSPPEDELCWATPLPCAFTVENVRLRDARLGIRAGFIRAK
jgi:hypothetical protein